MSRNGSGVYSPSATGYPAVASTTIESAKFNAVIADIATALTGSIACNGESTITGNIPLAGYKITGLGNASADTDALNRVTADARYGVLSGPTFTGPVVINAAQPVFDLKESDADADEKIWRWTSVASTLVLRAVNDADDNSNDAISIARTGDNIASIALNSIDVTPSSGNFTMELATDASGGTVLASGTAYWKKVAGVVTIRLPALYAATSDTGLVLRGIPADCQPSLSGTYTQSFVVEGLSEGTNVGVVIRVIEGVDYWGLCTVEGGSGLAFPAGSGVKGIGSSYSGPTITYQVTD